MAKLFDVKMSAEQWQKLLLDVEWKTLSATVSELNRLFDTPNTTSKDLASVVLRDLTLTSRVLKISRHAEIVQSNSSVCSGITDAIERVGFNGLRAICISTPWLDSGSDGLELNPQLHQLINQSFEIAVHARNLAQKMMLNEEESFVAGLLLNVGELAFWFSDIPSKPEYQKLICDSNKTPEQAFTELSGKTFHEMSLLLAEQWQLSDLLLNVLNVEPTNSVKSVLLGREINKAAKNGWHCAEMNKLLGTQVSALGLNLTEALDMMQAGSKEAQLLADSYQKQQALWAPQQAS